MAYFLIYHPMEYKAPQFYNFFIILFIVDNWNKMHLAILPCKNSMEGATMISSKNVCVGGAGYSSSCNFRVEAKPLSFSFLFIYKQKSYTSCRRYTKGETFSAFSFLLYFYILENRRGYITNKKHFTKIINKWVVVAI